MEHNIKIYHTTNSGLLMELDKAKLLVDGISSDAGMFNCMGALWEDSIFKSVFPFSDIDCLLFTHCHEDHFDGERVSKYMETYKDVLLMAPKEALKGSGVQKTWHEAKERIFIPDGKTNNHYSIKGAEVFFLKTKHLECKGFECKEHYSIIIKGQSRNFFVAGDMQLDEESSKMFFGCQFDAVFFNPVVLGNRKSREVFKSLHARRKFIYHIPLEKYDRFYYRKLAISNLKKYEGELGNCELLLDEMQDITL